MEVSVQNLEVMQYGPHF